MTADELRALLTLKISNDKRIAALLKKIAAGKGSFGDTMNYALISGELTGEQLAEVVLELTEDREELVRLLVHDRWEDINEQCAAVQTVLDESNALHLAPQKAPFPTERVMQIAHSLSDPTVSDDTIRRRARSVSNVVVSMHDDFIEANAKFRSGAGLQCFVTRETDGSCCPWCTRLAGRYKYPEDIPDEIFQRHDNCGCTVTYENGRKRQDVWSKRTWEAPDKEAESQKPTVFNREQAQKLQADNAPKRLTYGAESGIINTRDIASRNLPNGLRTAPNHILTDDEILSLKKDIEAIGADLKIFKFNSGRRTGYDDVLDEIRVKGDILPDLNSNHPRDRMSSRAALAHEYYGHRANRGTKLPNGAWNDEFRASYMAAKNCPNLSDEERRDLILDALERAKEKGITIRNNDFIRRTLYGY